MGHTAWTLGNEGHNLKRCNDYEHEGMLNHGIISFLKIALANPYDALDYDVIFKNKIKYGCNYLKIYFEDRICKFIYYQ